MLRRRLQLAAVLALLAPALGPAPAALARGGDDVRVDAACGRGAEAELRLKADDGTIEVELRVDTTRWDERWRVVLVHERRVAWRGTARTRSGDFRIRRSLPDYAGADQVTAVASGPRGVGCQASGVLSGS